MALPQQWPPRSEQVSEDAFRWAGHLRSVRAATQDALGAGRSELSDVLAERCDPAVGSIHLLCVLEALPGARKVDTRRRLAAAGLDGRRPLHGLTEREVAVVTREFSAEAST